MPSVLILGARAPVALDHARRFAAQGWRVVVGDSAACRMAGWSRSVSACQRLPSGRYDLVAYAAALRQLVETQRIDLVLPTCEEVFYLARCRPSLPARVRVLVDDFDKLACVHSKWRFLQLAQGCGATVPESGLVDAVDECTRLGR